MHTITDRVNNLELGDVQVHKNIAVVSLLGENSNLEYLVLDDALNSGLEIKETQSVPLLGLKNKSGSKVLVMQGEYVKGGSQNRMMATSMFLKDGFRGDVPVSCVERRRWDGKMDPFRSPKTSAPSYVKYAASKGQGSVWESVNAFSRANLVESRTDDMGEVYLHRKKKIDDYVRQFEFLPGSVGLVVATRQNGNLRFGVDFFDQSSTMEKHFGKLVESYVVDAMSRDENLLNRDSDIKIDAGVFLHRAGDFQFNPQTSVSLGENFGLQGQREEGIALVYEESPLYVSFGSTDNENDNDMARRSSEFETGYVRPRLPIRRGPGASPEEYRRYQS